MNINNRWFTYSLVRQSSGPRVSSKGVQQNQCHYIRLAVAAKETQCGNRFRTILIILFLGEVYYRCFSIAFLTDPIAADSARSSLQKFGSIL